MKKLILFGIALVGISSLFGQQVKWYSFEEAVELRKKEPRKLVIDIYTDWCGWCKVMDKNTFNNQHIAKYMNEQYYPVKLNAEQQKNITFNGVTYKYIEQGRSGVHELAYALLQGKLGYPSVVILNEKNQILQHLSGYKKAKEFDQIIKFIGEDKYNSMSFEEFLKSYKSPIQ